jgi:hypothetical protein
MLLEKATQIIHKEYPDLQKQDANQFDILVSLLIKYGYDSSQKHLLDSLDEIERKIVKLKYFDGYLTHEGVMMELNMGNRNTYFKIITAIMKQNTCSSCFISRSSSALTSNCHGNIVTPPL